MIASVRGWAPTVLLARDLLSVNSFQDAELEVRRERRVEDASAFELQARAELAEQGSARSKE